jgi:hypothetical protein
VALRLHNGRQLQANWLALAVFLQQLCGEAM